MVCLSETKLSCVEMKQLHDQVLSFRGKGYNGIYVDARGRARGLTLLWEKDVTISLLL